MIFTRDILLRARIVLLLVLLIMFSIIGKIIHLQFIKGNQWRTCAQVTQLIYKPILGSRGNIYADDGSLLATSLPLYRVGLDPTIVSDSVFHAGIDALSQQLASFFGDHTPETYKKRITGARNKKKKYILLNSRYINHEAKEKMQKWPIFEHGRYKGGVVFQVEHRRYNPFKELAKRTIGMHREIGGFGLEYAFHKMLRGLDGQALYQKVVGGNWRQVQEGVVVPPMHGSDLETTIDIHLQDITQNSLLDVLRETNAQHGCAVVMEVSTGGIKAMANLSRTPSGDYAELYNYAVGNQGSVEPGSIFKLISMLALLEESGWSLNKTIDTGNGTVQFHNRWMKDVKKGGYGLLSLQEVFENSSNVGISIAVQEIFGTNPQKFIDYIEALSIHRPLGIELVGEGKPYVVTPKSSMWSKVSLPWLSIGYNLEITPLHILTLYNAVANNGKMVKPMLVRSIRSADGQRKEFPTIVLKEKICSEATLHKLRSMLEGTVERGLARNLKYGFYKIAGKTGTAEKLVDGSYSNNHLTSFAGYFPADKPQYSCIIVVDSPQGEQYRFGAEVPAPIFKKIVDRIAGKDVYGREPIGTASLVDASMSDILVSLNKKAIDRQSQVAAMQLQRLIPNVLHKKLRDALFLLESLGLEVAIEGDIHGNVYKQSLKAGTAILVDHPKILIQLR